MKLLRRIRHWMRYLFSSKSKTKKSSGRYFQFVRTNEIPEKLDPTLIYILNEGLMDEALYFKCPCNCDSNIELNLLKDSSPLWNYYITKQNQITISPSVWRNTGCRSHFFIRSGNVVWTNN